MCSSSEVTQRLDECASRTVQVELSFLVRVVAVHVDFITTRAND